ncbi:uncharacterized protein LACBIDRAFT_315296 [Laccaria bicolor S238N-H82]|uniref:Predicted protein n=1 Tax=Laccaria bicolor (strain S238N-H82 / ATCC MYA-4686) TaxID=486041 RepID=B0E099_LACBS|nr:uncharacterized protein LACBIDRAFT_315296 [Laccaria bicolor S238N-H82]EDQ99747.1 predicted protein [Laccaria bicolor S238N-H82]|eukprot:XP_001889583.1 predicted protein [Laccaria bicolor S238N-H82]
MLGSSFASLTQQAQFQTYFQVAITAAVLYDHVITLDVEKKKWSAVNVFFIINRYLGEAVPLYLARVLILRFSPQDLQLIQLLRCNIASKVQGWGSHVVIWSMQAIMLYRICCLYKNSRKVTIWMSILFALEIISMVVTDALYLRDLPSHGGSNAPTSSGPSSPCPPGPPPSGGPPGPPPSGGPPGHPPSGLPPPSSSGLPFSQGNIPVCLVFSPSWYLISWTPIFVLELLILLMGLRAGLSYFKETRSLPSLNRFPLHSILLRDSILFPMM